MNTLPKIKHPIFKTKLLSNEVEISYRPFTVKEEKILLLAKQAKDMEQISTAITQVISNCILSDIEIETLPLFDITYLLLAIRSISISNGIKFTIEDDETGEDIQLEVNIDNITLEKNPDHNNIIKLDDNNVMVMKYPAMQVMAMLQEDDAEGLYKIMLSCIDHIVSDESNVINASDFSFEEMNEFVESLDSETLQMMQKFFNTIPEIKHTIKYKNSAGTEKTFVIQGLDNFFI